MPADCPPGLSLASIHLAAPQNVRFGRSMERSQAGNVQRVQQALEIGGVEFIRENGGGAGMRLRKATPDAG